MNWILWYYHALFSVLYWIHIFFPQLSSLFLQNTHTTSLQATHMTCYGIASTLLTYYFSLFFLAHSHHITSHRTAHTYYSSLLVLSLPKTPTSRNTNTNKIKKIQVARELGWEWVKLYFTLIIISVSVSPRQVVVMRWQVVYSKK